MEDRTCAGAIKEAMIALGGQADIKKVKDWINHNYPNGWKGVGTMMADLTYPGNKSSSVPVEERFLQRVDRGVYRLR